MPRIILPPLPRNGDDLLLRKAFSDPDDHYTRSTYARLRSPEPNSGLMSQVNGRLSFKNFSESTEIQDYHIQPRQAAFCGSEGMMGTSTIYGNGVAANAPGSENGYFTLPGCSFRWYQPFDTTVSLMQWSFFVSFNTWRGLYKDMEGEVHGEGVETPIFLRCRLDDNVVDSTTRRLGQNFFHPQSPGAIDKDNQTGPGVNTRSYLEDTYGGSMLGFPSDLDEGLDGDSSWGSSESFFDFLSPITTAKPETKKNDQRARGGNPKYVQTEAHTGVHFDFHHSTSLSKGFHEISVEASIGQPKGAGVYLQNLGRTDVTGLTGRGYFNLVGKLSLGIRNARVLNLL